MCVLNYSQRMLLNGNVDSDTLLWQHSKYTDQAKVWGLRVPCDCSPGCLSDTIHTLSPSLTLLDALAGPHTSPACICSCTSLPWIPCTCFSHCLELLPLDSRRLTPQFTPFFPIESSTWNVTPITSSFFVFYHSIYGDPVSYYVSIIY